VQPRRGRKSINYWSPKQDNFRCEKLCFKGSTKRGKSMGKRMGWIFQMVRAANVKNLRQWLSSIHLKFVLKKVLKIHVNLLFSFPIKL